MEGEAVHWYRFIQKRNPSLSWQSLTPLMLQRFGEGSKDNVFERLKTLKQEESVDVYLREFEILVAQIPDPSEEQMLGYFLGSLQPEIRCRVRSFRPTEVLRAMEIARDVDEELRLARGQPPSQRVFFPPRFQHKGSVVISNPASSAANTAGNYSASQARPATTGARNIMTAPKGVSSCGSNNPHSGSAGTFSRNKGARQLPYAEFLKRKEEGRCFRCGLAFGFGHKCPEGSLRITILGEDEGDNIEENDKQEPEETNDVVGDQYHCQWMELSQLVQRNITPPKTMKLWGEMAGVGVTILIDSGASHNFVARDLISRMNWPIQPTRSFGVQLGNGHRQESQGYCQNLILKMQGYVYTGDFFLFDLGGVDVILGMSWLA